MTLPVTDTFGLVGRVFADRFRVERVVGEGGFATVYAARHLALDIPVAVKVMKPPVVDDSRRPAFDALFLAEARTIARLRHPAIVQITDCGIATEPSGASVAWMALEWLDGHTLELWLEARRGHGGLTPTDALALLRPALEGVAYAHEQGFAHRDLKPANLMMVAGTHGPALRVMDFGVAKAMTGGEAGPASGYTNTRSTAGGFSPPYAAPEQVTNTRTGPWTDVHALALILVELLSDQAPYPARTPAELFARILAETRPTPARFGVDAGPWEVVLARALTTRTLFARTRGLIQIHHGESRRSRDLRAPRELVAHEPNDRHKRPHHGRACTL